MQFKDLLWQTEVFAEQGLKWIAACLHDPSSDVRIAAAEALPHSFAKLLTESLRDSSSEVREVAARRLAAMDLHTSGILDHLKLCLRGSDMECKIGAASVLGCMSTNNPAVLELAVSFFGDAARDVRIAALGAISKLDEKGEVSSKIMQEALADSDAAVRSTAWTLRQKLRLCSDDIDIDSFVSGLVKPHQNLRDFLCEVRPKWTGNELGSALRKLHQVGVESVEQLQKSLPTLNTRLSEAGQRCFSRETLQALATLADIPSAASISPILFLLNVVCRRQVLEESNACQARHLETTPHFAWSLFNTDGVWFAIVSHFSGKCVAVCGAASAG